MDSISNPIYYNPFDRRCWKAIAIGLPLLIAATVVFSVVGWLIWGHAAATIPKLFMQPLNVAGFAILGAVVTALAAVAAWVIGLVAHAIGRSVIDAAKPHRSN